MRYAASQHIGVTPRAALVARRGVSVSCGQRATGRSLAALVAVAGGLWLLGCSRSPPANGVATLSWTAVQESVAGQPLADIAGYHIYYGTSRSAMSKVAQVTDPHLTSYRVTGLAAGTWYFTVVAYTRLGIEGKPSNVAVKMIQ